MLFKLLLALLLYLPFQIALSPMSDVDLASIRVFILAFFLLWLASGLKNRNLRINPNLETFLILTFLFLNGLSILWAQNLAWGIRKFVYFLSIFPLYFIISANLNSREHFLRIIKVLLGSGFLVALIGIFQFLGQFILGIDGLFRIWAQYIALLFWGGSFGTEVLSNPSWLVNISGHTYFRAISLFPDPHMFSFYLGLLIPLSLGMFIYKSIKKTDSNGRFYPDNLIYLIVFLTLLVADILTFSRGGYIGLFSGALTIFILSWKKIGKKHKVLSLTAAFILIILLVFPSPVSQRLISSFDLREGSNIGRLEMWKVASETTWDHPEGVGLGNYILEVKPTAVYREHIYAHNTYLDIAAESGVINSFLWISLFLVLIITSLKKSFREPLFLYISISLVIFAVHSIFETGLFSPVVLSLLLTIFSLGSYNLENEHFL